MCAVNSSSISTSVLLIWETCALQRDQASWREKDYFDVTSSLLLHHLKPTQMGLLVQKYQKRVCRAGVSRGWDKGCCVCVCVYFFCWKIQYNHNHRIMNCVHTVVITQKHWTAVAKGWIHKLGWCPGIWDKPLKTLVKILIWHQTVPMFIPKTAEELWAIRMELNTGWVTYRNSIFAKWISSELRQVKTPDSFEQKKRTKVSVNVHPMIILYVSMCYEFQETIRCGRTMMSEMLLNTGLSVLYWIQTFLYCIGYSPLYTVLNTDFSVLY